MAIFFPIFCSGLVFLLGFTGSSSADKYEKGFVATFGKFSPMPKTLAEAKKQGWTATSESCHNGGAFNGYRVIEEDDVALALLYDKNGQIAGYQALFPYDIFENSPYEYKYEPMIQRTKIKGVEYWQLTLYLVHPGKICSSYTTPRDLEEDGVDEYVYYQNGAKPADEYLVAVPKDRKEAVKQGWDSQNCFPQMGYHSLYHVKDFTESSCRRFFPALVLYDAEYGKLIGAGFWIYARGETTSPRYELPPPKVVQIIMGEEAPQCILEDVTTSLHMYFVKDPASIDC